MLQRWQSRPLRTPNRSLRIRRRRRPMWRLVALPEPLPRRRRPMRRPRALPGALSEIRLADSAANVFVDLTRRSTSAGYNFEYTPISGRGEGVLERKSLAKPLLVLIST